MKLELDVPWWLIYVLRRHLEHEVATLHEQCISRADLDRAERQRRALALVIGQLDTHLEAYEHGFEQSLVESHRREVYKYTEDGDSA